MSRFAKLFALGITLAFTTALRAEGMVEAHLEAVGGSDAIAKIKTIHRTGTLSGTSGYGPLSGTVEEIFDLPKQQGYTSMEMPGYSRKTGWTGNSGWVSDTQAGVTKMPADEVALARINAGPSPLASIHRRYGGAMKEAGEKEFHDQKCAVVTIEGSPIQFFVNQKTKLLEGMSIPGTFTVTYENYKAVDGVQFAGKSSVQIEAQNMTMVTDYKTTKINGQIDPSKFKKPSSRSEPARDTAPAESFTARQIISYLDSNGDGKISKDEASNELKPNFQFVDTNSDGAIDLEEAELLAKYANAQQAGSTKPAPATSGPVTAKQIVSSMDSNGDGKITKDEASEDLRLFFANMDANGDGAIDLTEAQVMADYANKEQAGSKKPAPATGGTTAKQIVDYLDKNGDGKIGKDEASDDLKPYFGQHDTNGDGVIDVKEAQVIADYVNSQQ